MPPPKVTLRCEKSSCSNPGVLSRPLNRVLTPGRMEKGTDFRILTNSGMSRGLVTSTLCAPMRMNTIAQAVSEKMWYSGNAAIATSWPPSSDCVTQAPTCCMFAIMFAWVSIAPLATPVVPPVYCRNARSS